MNEVNKELKDYLNKEYTRKIYKEAWIKQKKMEQ